VTRDASYSDQFGTSPLGAFVVWSPPLGFPGPQESLLPGGLAVAADHAVRGALAAPGGRAVIANLGQAQVVDVGFLAVPAAFWATLGLVPVDLQVPELLGLGDVAPDAALRSPEGGADTDLGAPDGLAGVVRAGGHEAEEALGPVSEALVAGYTVLPHAPFRPHRAVTVTPQLRRRVRAVRALSHGTGF
jgi:hypothetical protein